MTRYVLLLFAAIINFSSHHGALAIEERSCDIDDGSYTLLEQILLFPISFMEENKCVQDLSDVTDNINEWQVGFIFEYTYTLLNAANAIGYEIFSNAGTTFRDLFAVKEWVRDLWTTKYMNIVDILNPIEFCKTHLTYIWNLDLAGSIVNTFNSVTMSILPTCFAKTGQLVDNLPDDVMLTISNTLQEIIVMVLKNPGWSVRVLTAFLLAVSLVTSMFKDRNYNKLKYERTEKNLNKHHSMCEIFDETECNCGGKTTKSDEVTNIDDVANDFIKHNYDSAGSFDNIPCTCSGNIYPDVFVTESNNDADISESNDEMDAIPYTVNEVETLYNEDDTADKDVSLDTDTKVTFHTAVESPSIDKVSNDGYLADSDTENVDNHWSDVIISKETPFVDVAQDEVASDDFQQNPYQNDDKENAESMDNNPYNDNETTNVSSLMREHFPMCELFDSLACNCGGRPTSSPQKHGADQDPTTTEVGDTVEYPEKKAYQRRVQMLQHSEDSEKSTSSLDSEDMLPNNVHFDYDICANDTPSANLEEQSGADDINEYNDDADDEDYGYTDDISESEIGAPFSNSSFKEDSANLLSERRVSFEDSFAGGDGMSSSFTLTRRSPYIEGGLEDLVSEAEDSYVDAETSLLDISSLDDSLSYVEGDGVFEFAVMLVVQTAWRVMSTALKKRYPPTKISNITVEEKSPAGYYLIRQKNKLKQYLTTRLSRNNSAFVDDNDDNFDKDEHYHDDDNFDENISEDNNDDGNNDQKNESYDDNVSDDDINDISDNNDGQKNDAKFNLHNDFKVDSNFENEVYDDDDDDDDNDEDVSNNFNDEVDGYDISYDNVGNEGNNSGINNCGKYDNEDIHINDGVGGQNNDDKLENGDKSDDNDEDIGDDIECNDENDGDNHDTDTKDVDDNYDGYDNDVVVDNDSLGNDENNHNAANIGNNDSHDEFINVYDHSKDNNDDNNNSNGHNGDDDNDIDGKLNDNNNNDDSHDKSSNDNHNKDNNDDDNNGDGLNSDDNDIDGKLNNNENNNNYDNSDDKDQTVDEETHESGNHLEVGSAVSNENNNANGNQKSDKESNKCLVKDTDEDCQHNDCNNIAIEHDNIAKFRKFVNIDEIVKDEIKAINKNKQDDGLSPDKLPKFSTLLDKAKQGDCNVWELNNEASTDNVSLNDSSRLLTWAWSGIDNSFDD